MTIKLAVNVKKRHKFGGKNGIAVASPRNSSFVFARWQHRTDGLAAICKCTFWLRVWNPKSPRHVGGQRPHLTHCVIGHHKCTCQMASKSVERLAEGTNVTDRQTTLGRNVMCSAWAGGIACTSRARAIARNNTSEDVCPLPSASIILVGLPSYRLHWALLTSDRFQLKIGTSVTAALGNVDTNIGLSKHVCIELGGCTEQTYGQHP